MYGLIAGLDPGDPASKNPFDKASVIREPVTLKSSLAYKTFGGPIDPNDVNAYGYGYDFARAMASAYPALSKMTTAQMCDLISKQTAAPSVVPEFAPGTRAEEIQREGRSDGDYNTTSTCLPCNEVTKETRHGGTSAPSTTL
jgi:hypothetical protein